MTYFVDNILSKAHHEAGIYIEEDDHTIVLKQHGREIVPFSIHATLENILHEADQLLEQSKSGISFEKG